MADTPPKVKVTERLTDINTYKKYAVYVLITLAFVLVTIGGVSLFNSVRSWLFPKPDKQINAPEVNFKPLSFSKVEKLDQTSTQIQMSEKPWEVGLGGGGLTWDNKAGIFIGGWVKRKW